MQTIGIIALSGACDKEKIENAKACLTKMGFKVELSKNIFDQNRYLAGNDEAKIEELYKFFKDTEIDLILNARGGYGTIRLINKIDYEIIKNNSKPFVGFSDITALLLMIYKKTGMITYHGPMASSDFGINPSPQPSPTRGEGADKICSEINKDFFSGLPPLPNPLPQGVREPSNLTDLTTDLQQGVRESVNLAGLAPTPTLPQGEGVNAFTWKWFKKAICNEQLEFNSNKIYYPGNAKGIIWGGNLATVVSLCGQDFIPDEDFIFFTEDLNEPVYKIDKMFQQLFNIEKFSKNCKGIILGEFLNTDNEIWLEDLFQSFTIPTLGGFKITHDTDKITIPIGKPAEIKDNQLIIF